jgi:hypothetical protein
MIIQSSKFATLFAWQDGSSEENRRANSFMHQRQTRYLKYIVALVQWRNDFINSQENYYLAVFQLLKVR